MQADNFVTEAIQCFVINATSIFEPNELVVYMFNPTDIVLRLGDRQFHGSWFGCQQTDTECCFCKCFVLISKAHSSVSHRFMQKPELAVLSQSSTYKSLELVLPHLKTVLVICSWSDVVCGILTVFTLSVWCDMSTTIPLIRLCYRLGSTKQPCTGLATLLSPLVLSFTRDRIMTCSFGFISCFR